MSCSASNRAILLSLSLSLIRKTLGLNSQTKISRIMLIPGSRPSFDFQMLYHNFGYLREFYTCFLGPDLTN